MKQNLLTLEFNKIFPSSQVKFFYRGSTGLYHLFKSIRAIHGTGEVIIPNLCCETVVLAAMFAGHNVVFADVTEDRLSITPETLEKVLSHRTVAVVLVHLFGLTTVADKFYKLRKKHPSVHFIEDVAHAVGGKDINGNEVGSSFDHAMFSFSDSKILKGQGGVIVSHNNDSVSDHLHSNYELKKVEEPDRLLSLSLRNLTQSIADLHRSGSSTLSQSISFKTWEQYRKLIINNGHFINIKSAASNFKNRHFIAYQRRNLALSYKDKIKSINYKIPDIHSEETCWRFSLIAVSPDLRRRATDTLRSKGVDVSNHYFPLSRLFTTKSLPTSEKIGDCIINLWVDESSSLSKIKLITNLLNKI